MCCDFPRVFGKEHHGRQPGRPDGITLGDGLRCIAHGIQWISDVPNFFTQMRHFGNTTGIVRNRAKRIDRDHNPGHRKHGHGRNRHTIQPTGLSTATDPVAAEDRHGNHHDRSRCRLHPHRQTGDDVGRMTGFTGFRNVLHRLILL